MATEAVSVLDSQLWNHHAQTTAHPLLYGQVIAVTGRHLPPDFTNVLSTSACLSGSSTKGMWPERSNIANVAPGINGWCVVDVHKDHS